MEHVHAVGEEDSQRAADEGGRAHILARVVTALLLANLVVSIVWVVSTGFQIGLLSAINQGGRFDIGTVEASDARQSALAMTNLVVYMITGAAWLIWQRRAHSDLKVDGLQFSPRFAVRVWFIPIVSFVYPYRSVRELWQASSGRPDWTQDRWSTLRWWWTFFLASIFLSLSVVAVRGEAVSRALARSWALAASIGAKVIAAVLAIQIVRAIDARQVRARTPQSARPQPYDSARAPLRARGPRGQIVIGLVVVLSAGAFALALVAGRGTSQERGSDTRVRIVGESAALDAGWEYVTDAADGFGLALPRRWERSIGARDAALVAMDGKGNVLGVFVEDVGPHFTPDSYADLVRQRLSSSYEQQGLSVHVVRQGTLRMPAGEGAEVWLSIDRGQMEQAYFVLLRGGRAWTVSVFTRSAVFVGTHANRFNTVAATFRFVGS